MPLVMGLVWFLILFRLLRKLSAQIRALRAGRRTTGPRIKVDRSAVRARVSTIQPTSASSRLPTLAATKSGRAARLYGSAELEDALMARGLTLAPAAEPTTSTSVSQGWQSSAPVSMRVQSRSGGINLAGCGDIP